MTTSTSNSSSPDLWSLVSIQLDHNHWAIAQILGRSGALTAEQYAQVFDIGPGSLQKTLAHMVEAMFFFSDSFKGERYRRRENWKQNSQTAAGLMPFLDAAASELKGSIGARLAAAPISATLAWPTAKTPVTTAVAIAQVFDHGSHHRAQCLNMLKQLNSLDEMEIYPLVWAAQSAAASA